MSGLWDAVDAYVRKRRARFHMPGHKGIGTGWLAAVLPYDITEVDGADSLFYPDGAIAALEQSLAQLYGGKQALLSAGGATLCIQTMLGLACGIGSKVIMSRNIHRAAINAAALLDLTPVWIYPDDSAGAWYAGRYTPAGAEAALQAHPDALAVYITSPDYFGVVSDLPGIAAVCGRYGVPLLVDNAHGAHFKWAPGMKHPMDCGAAISCDSLHKTMPAMTGGAALHLADGRYGARAKQMMSVFGSTSPSYPILLSCETALRYGAHGAAEGFDRTAHRLESLRQQAEALGLVIPQGVTDPAKLSFCFGARSISGETAGAHLRAKGVEPEYISGTACVLMANGYNQPEDYIRLERALETLPLGETRVPQRLELPHPQSVQSVRDAAFSLQERVSVTAAVGRIAAGEISLCPPGIPVVMPGELLDKDTCALLSHLEVTEVAVCS